MMNEFIEIKNLIEKMLIDNPEWIERYNKYADDLCKREPIKISDYIKVPKNLVACTSLTKSSNIVELRYNGDTVAIVNIKNNITLKLCNSKNAKKYLKNFNSFSGKVDWLSPKGTEFRTYFENIENYEKKEHGVEIALKKEFNKQKKGNSIFRGIKPIMLYNMPFQMPTPISASGAKNKIIKYAKEKGGGIDILCRTGRGTATRLTVIELKDLQNLNEIKKESPKEVMKQTISYATFIRELLRNDNRNFWWKFFGFKKTKDLVINTVVAIPKNKIIEMDKSFANERIYFENSNDCLELHYFYYDYNNLNIKADTSLPGYDK